MGRNGDLSNADYMTIVFGDLDLFYGESGVQVFVSDLLCISGGYLSLAIAVGQIGRYLYSIFSEQGRIGLGVFGSDVVGIGFFKDCLDLGAVRHGCINIEHCKSRY